MSRSMVSAVMAEMSFAIFRMWTVVYTSSVDLEDIYDESTLELIRWFYDFFDSLHSVIPGFEFSFIYRPLADITQWNYQDMTALIDMRFIAVRRDTDGTFPKSGALRKIGYLACVGPAEV